MLEKLFEPNFSRYFREPLDVYTQFIPQILFLACIFFYLCIMIFYKWTHFSVFVTQTSVGVYPGPHCAPSLLIGLINMFMFKTREVGFNGPVCYLNVYYAGQVSYKFCFQCTISESSLIDENFYIDYNSFPQQARCENETLKARTKSLSFSGDLWKSFVIVFGTVIERYGKVFGFNRIIMRTGDVIWQAVFSL